MNNLPLGIYFDVESKSDEPHQLGKVAAVVSLCESFGSLKKARAAYEGWLAFCDSEHPEAGQIEADPSGWIVAEIKALLVAYGDRQIPEGTNILFE